MLKQRSWVALTLLSLALCACGRDEPPQAPESDAAPAPGAKAPAYAEQSASPADQAASEAEAADTTLNDVDREFATSAFASNIAEVQAGRLAAEKTLNEDVRAYAQDMVKAHTAANDELTKLAKTRKIDLPTSPIAALKEDLQQLTTVTGPQHDRFYMDRFGIHAHRETLQLYEREIREGQDGDLKRYAERQVPVLREHLQRAERLRESVETAR